MRRIALAVMVLLGLSGGSHAASVTLAWDAPPTGPVPDGYRLERRVPPATTWTERSRGPERQHTDTVEVAQQVCWRVRSTLVDVVSDPTPELCRTVPAAPGNLRIVVTIELSVP